MEKKNEHVGVGIYLFFNSACRCRQWLQLVCMQYLCMRAFSDHKGAVQSMQPAQSSF